MSSVEVRLSGTNLERAAAHNQRVILHAIRVHSEITRIALAGVTGLTAPAVANIVKRLIEEGLVEEFGRLRQGRGQPGKLLRIRDNARLTFGVNIDRDRITLVLVNFAGHMLARREFDEAFALPGVVRELWMTNANDMLEQTGLDQSLLIGIGVAMPDDLGAIYLPGAPAGYSAWQSFDTATLFSEPFDVPVFIENDAAAATMGEHQFGAGSRLSSTLYILISSGLGGGVMIDGHYVRGASGRSGEIGLMPSGPGETVQDVVSLTGLATHLARHGHSLADLEGMTPGSTCDLAFEGWMSRAVERLIGPLSAVNCLLNPTGILLGSRLPPACIDRFALAIEAALDAVRPKLPSRAPIRRAELSADAPAIGAAILPFAHYLLPDDDALWKNEAVG